MGMVPRSSVQAGQKLVGEAFAGSNRTLSYSGRSVLPRSPLLKKAMPMNDRSLLSVRYVIMNIHDDLVAPVGFDKRPGEGTVDEENLTLISIGGD